MAVCLLFARMHAHTHTHTRTHVCGISREVMVSACIHTQVCCRNEESVVMVTCSDTGPSLADGVSL